MAQWHGISRRKPSGGRKVQARGKRSTEISTEKQMALIGESKTKIYRRTGGNTLVRVLAADKVSINDPKTGKRKTVGSSGRIGSIVCPIEEVTKNPEIDPKTRPKPIPWKIDSLSVLFIPCPIKFDSSNFLIFTVFSTAKKVVNVVKAAI